MGKTKNQELTERAVKDKWLIKTPDDHFWLLAPKMTKLIKDIQQLLIDSVAKELNYDEWIFPRIIPEDAIQKTGWLKHHPHQAFTVGTLPYSDNFLNRYMLDPIQCVSFYNAFKDQVIEDKLPLKIVEYLGGWTYRNESINDSDGFFKSKTFLRVEFITIGNERDVITLRNAILKKGLKILNTTYGLDLDKAKGDSCFIESPKNDDKHYNIIGSQVTDTTETIDIIYKRKDPAEFLELASGSIVGTHISKSFSIKSNAEKDLWSGCFGFGLNRIALVILEHSDFKLHD